MVVLVVPMFSVTHLNADSNYVIMRHVIPEIVEERPDIMFEILWPSNGADWKYFADGFFDHPNLKRRPFYFDPAKMRQVLSFDPRAWHKLLDYKGQYHDLIWNNTVEIGDALKFFHPRYVENARTLIANFHHYVMHRSLNYPIEAYQHVLMRQLTGSIGADVNVVNSQYTAEMLLDNCDEYLSEEMTRQIDSSLETIGYGTLSPDRPEYERHETFTFAYNHRLQDYKKWRETFKMYDEIYKVRQDFRVHVFASGSDQHVGEIAPRPYVKILEPPNHQAYLSELSKCHANVTHTLYETFCVSALESMMFDQHLIAPNGLTFPEITGGHAQLFDSYNASRRMATEIIDADWPNNDGGEYVRKQWSSQTTASKISQLFSRMTESVKVKESLRRIETWQGLVESKDVWTMEELRKSAYSSRSEEGRALAAGQSFPCVKIKRLANEFGYADSWNDRGELVLSR